MKRIIRKSRAISSADARHLLQAVVLAELVNPSEVIWVVSPWITDVQVIQNDGQFNEVVSEYEDRSVHFSEALAALTRRGSTIVVASRSDSSNDVFKANLRRAEVNEAALIEHENDALHEKTFTGDGYVVTGSMNFTRAGLDFNEEQIVFEDDISLVAEVRAALRSRWGP